MRSSCFGLRSHHLLYLGDRDKKTTIYIDFNLPSFFLNFTHSLDSLSKSISILVICLPWLKIPGVLKREPLMQFTFSSGIINIWQTLSHQMYQNDVWKIHHVSENYFSTFHGRHRYGIILFENNHPVYISTQKRVTNTTQYTIWSYQIHSPEFWSFLILI